MREPSNHPFLNLRLWLPLVLSATLGLGMLIGLRLKLPPPQVRWQPSTSFSDQVLPQGKIDELLRYIDSKYVDKIDQEKLVDEAIKGIVGQLDPHSSYIPASALAEVNAELEGQFTGIGVEFLFIRDTVVIAQLMPEGPALQSGLRPGDRIVQVGDSVLTGKKRTSAQVVALMRGVPNSRVVLRIKRPGEKKLRTFNLNRKAIPINSIEAAYPLNGKIGYLKISRFTSSTPKEFIEKVQTLQDQHQVEDLVIDLRQNPGGYMQVAADILSQLFPQKGTLLFYTQGRHSARTEYKTSGRAYFNLNRVVVLIDEGSASASEILAGAIQDLDRGTIIGRRSFGKGLVQEQYQLSDGSALRLTMARYYTPSGRSIQKPYRNTRNHYDDEATNRLHNGELLSAQNIRLTDQTPYFTSQGRTVFAHGGIIPDIFVPLDSHYLDPLFRDIQQQIPAFVLEKASGSLTAKEQQPQAFRQLYTVPAQLLEAFFHYLQQAGLSATPKHWEKLQPLISQAIKVELARQQFGEAWAVRVSNDGDPMIKKAQLALPTAGKPVTQNRQR